LKKFLQGFAIFTAVAVIAIYLGREPLKEMAMGAITKDMFVAEDTDAFDAGLAVGTRFPALNVRYQGEQINDMGQFLSDRGMIFIANRSADW
jgi:hypothetical protein